MRGIPRADFKALIEHGIAAGRIGPEPAAKLRKVGETAKRIGTGAFAVQTSGRTLCHCPMSAAHLADDNGDPRPRSGVTGQQVAVFARTFDDATSAYTRRHRTVITEADEGDYFIVV